jgi:plastocyanin
MKKIIGILFCICLTLSAVSITAEQNDSNKSSLSQQPLSDRVTIEILASSFNPSMLIVDLGTNVTWINHDVAPHSVVADNGEFDSHILEYGESFSYVFSKQGPYPYHCGYHPQVKGKVFANEGGNQPPAKPSVQGTTDGSRRTNYTYIAFTLDPEGMSVSYYFDWGDNTNSGWSDFVPSGDAVNATHQWAKAGNYQIKVQAKDSYSGATSEWGTLDVSMPVKIDLPFYRFIEQLFERFPHAFPLLRQVLGY